VSLHIPEAFVVCINEQCRLLEHMYPSAIRKYMEGYYQLFYLQYSSNSFELLKTTHTTTVVADLTTSLFYPSLQLSHMLKGEHGYYPKCVWL
jgi:hypothetical protein